MQFEGFFFKKRPRLSYKQKTRKTFINTTYRGLNTCEVETQIRSQIPSGQC